MAGIYIAGKLGTAEERLFLEEIAALCEKMGFETFLPHRDGGILKSIKEVKRVFEKDIHVGLDNCQLVIASLNGLHVGAGTAWELGYAYAKGVPCVGIKTDEPVSNALEYLSAIIIHSTPILNSLKKLKKEIPRLIKHTR